MPSLGCGAIVVVYVFSLVKASTNHRSFQQESFVQKIANVHSQNCPPNVKKVSIGDLNMIKCSLACLEGGDCNVFMYKDGGACYIGEDLNTSDDPGTVQMDDIYRLYLENCNQSSSLSGQPTSCQDILGLGVTCNGLYTIYPDSVTPTTVYCDMHTLGGGWTIELYSFIRLVCSDIDYIYHKWQRKSEKTDIVGIASYEIKRAPCEFRDILCEAQLAVVVTTGLTDEGLINTVFQRRKDGSVNFNLNWADYKAGFGTIENYWIGNDMLHMLTASQDTELYVIMRDWNCDVYYARYTSFWTASEVDGYRLTINGYSGTAGDAMSYNNGRRFTTKDRDYDGGVSDNCAVRFHDGGWWFNYCTITDLNGRYVQGMINDDRSMHWKRIHGERYALESAVMMVRRR